MRRKTKAIIAVTLAACMTLMGTVMAFAETTEVDAHVDKVEVTHGEDGHTDWKTDPTDAQVYVNEETATDSSCEINGLQSWNSDSEGNGTATNWKVDDKTEVTINSNNAAYDGSRTEEGVTYCTYVVSSSSQTETDGSDKTTGDDQGADKKGDDQGADKKDDVKPSEKKEDVKVPEIQDEEKSDSSNKNDDDDDRSDNASQFVVANTATTATTGAVTVGNTVKATVDPSSSDYSTKAVSLIADAPQGGTVEMEITSAAYLDEAIVNALAARSDVAVNLTINYMGVPFVINIPAGYNLKALMKDGKIDFAKLIETFVPSAA